LPRRSSSRSEWGAGCGAAGLNLACWSMPTRWQLSPAFPAKHMLRGVSTLLPATLPQLTLLRFPAAAPVTTAPLLQAEPGAGAEAALAAAAGGAHAGQRGAPAV
jgi:hypothetical protein